jgi:hypothetical protein
MNKKTANSALPVTLAAIVAGVIGCTAVHVTNVFTTPVQSLPKPGNPRPGTCGKLTYTTSVVFNNGGYGYNVKAGSNHIVVYANSNMVPTKKYFIAAYNIGNPNHPIPFCITNNAAGDMTFFGAVPDKDIFTVCFIDNTYNNNEKVYLEDY